MPPYTENGRIRVLTRTEAEQTFNAMNELVRSVFLVTDSSSPTASGSFSIGFDQPLPDNPEFLEETLDRMMTFQSNLAEIVIKPQVPVSGISVELPQQFQSETEYHHTVNGVSLVTRKGRVVEEIDGGGKDLVGIRWSHKKGGRTFEDLGRDPIYNGIPLKIEKN